MSSSYENVTEEVELPEQLLRRAALRELQQRQAAALHKAGILTRALFAAERRNDEVPEESAYWACVYHDTEKNTYGIRFTAYYADEEGELPLYFVEVPVYEMLEDIRRPFKPFDEAEANAIAAAVAELEFEKGYGDFYDLSSDLTDLVEPTVVE
jgi:hypothetical protein